MGIDTPKARGANRRSQGPLAGPGDRAVRNSKPAFGVSNKLVRLVAPGRRRYHLILERQYSLDQSSDPGRGLRVADVGLDRADEGWTRFPPSRPQLSQSGSELGSVSGGSAGT